MQILELMKLVTKIAIPLFGDSIAPCFEVAKLILMVETDGESTKSHTISTESSEGFRKVRLLRVHQPDFLICNGIKTIYRDMLTASGVDIISGISLPVDDALRKFAQGELEPATVVPVERSRPEPADRAHLITWTRKYFEQAGYTVSPGPGGDYFMIDLIASIKCPVCTKTVNVAICCGAHTYRTTQDIAEFYFETPSGYNARLFVWPSIPEIQQCCDEYGIELIDPAVFESDLNTDCANRLPLLKGAVTGHERASGPFTAG